MTGHTTPAARSPFAMRSHSEELREQIAIEAARLMLRGKEQSFAAARKRAARWMRRKRLTRDEIPSNAEIQVQIYALSGVMAAERDPVVRHRVREFAVELMAHLAEWSPRAGGPALADSALPGAELQIALATESRAAVAARLRHAGYLVRSAVDEGTSPWQLEVRKPFPTRITASVDAHAGWSLDELKQQLSATPDEFETPDDEHEEAFDVMRLLLAPLERVRLDPQYHPEGDALYHSLQVFELGRLEKPYDEEFLLACLLHDVGQGINPRHPVKSAIDALGTLITDRTRFLIEQRPVASEYLRTGACPKSLRRSEDFDDAVLLAQCDRNGRVAGADVCTLDEALDYIAGLDQLWDETEEDQPEA